MVPIEDRLGLCREQQVCPSFGQRFSFPRNSRSSSLILLGMGEVRQRGDDLISIHICLTNVHPTTRTLIIRDAAGVIRSDVGMDFELLLLRPLRT